MILNQILTVHAYEAFPCIGVGDPSIGYPVGVKSGTAQVQNGASDNSLLVGFNDDPNLPIAFCVVIEDRVSGEISTSDIVSTMLNALNQN